MRRPVPHVVLVDCIPDDQQMYGEYFEIAGLSTVVICDVASAFEHAISEPAHVMVIDTSHEQTSGLELVRRLRGDQRTDHIAIIVISGHVFPHDRAAAMQAGCDVFLPKPCLPDKLVTEIRRLSYVERP